MGGGFATRVPWIQDRAGAGAAELGLAPLAPAVGTLLAMPAAGWLIHRLGGRAITGLALAAWRLALALALPPLAPGLVTLWLCPLVYGAAGGLADVAMNDQGVEIEPAAGSPIRSGLHGLWSIGAPAGAGTGAPAAHAGVDARAHLAAAALVLLACGLFAVSRLPASRPDPAIVAQPRFALPCRSGGDAVVARLGPVRTVRSDSALGIVLARDPAPRSSASGFSVSASRW